MEVAAQEKARIPQNTCFYASLLMGLTHTVQALAGVSVELSPLEEQVDTDLGEWVDVKAETELNSGWVHVKSDHQDSATSSVML